MTKISFSLSIVFIFFTIDLAHSQALSNTQIAGIINEYKTDPRGPYKEIRWFCDDGSIIGPKEECPKPGGVQHASYKDKTAELAKKNHIFFGQILTGTDKEQFWDAENENSRLIQYLLETYLQSIDEGWVSRKAQYYRGAKQIEDEAEWGEEFLQWVLKSEERTKSNYLLIRNAARDIPHFAETGVSQRVRATSKVLGDDLSDFMEIRIKIHGNPEAKDMMLVQNYQQNKKEKLGAKQNRLIDSLMRDMKLMFQPLKSTDFSNAIKLSKDTSLIKSLNYYRDFRMNEIDSRTKLMAASELLSDLKRHIFASNSGKEKLALVDLSNKLEQVVFLEAEGWQTPPWLDWSEKACYMGMALEGGGYIENWEWDHIESEISFLKEGKTNLASLETMIRAGRKLVEWSTQKIKGIYEKDVNTYQAFEPLSYPFIDNQVRSSIILPFGQLVSQLGATLSDIANIRNDVLGIQNQSLIRGLNPGYAKGVLVVKDDQENVTDMSSDKIYIFNKPPADMKPVAGIATVSEGNLVSHVQLLARNLGIPNAVFNEQHISALMKFDGMEIFYAVGPKGNVIMKKAEDMSKVEVELFTKKERNTNKVFVNIDSLKTEGNEILDIANVDAKASGKYSGPKAANFGQLKSMFSENVVDGLIIPFSIFKEHMDLEMPNQDGQTYWAYLNASFATANRMAEDNSSESEIELFLLNKLGILSEAVTKINLKTSFIAKLESSFQSTLHGDLGTVPVFLRSDTNMEDLAEFTGAGLNKTLFNVVDKQAILDGIKEVWASPYAERSYKWRQKFLLNPENVFPSILIIPSVNVERSGVIITKGLTSGKDRSITVAFSRGVGGAVDGQSAEMYELHPNGYNELLSSSREKTYLTIPARGGTVKETTNTLQPILSKYDLYQIRKLVKDINERMPKLTGKSGPYDIELGFKDNKLWLFQIRPFVENKNAKNSTYLQSITPEIDSEKIISSDHELN